MTECFRIVWIRTETGKDDRMFQDCLDRVRERKPLIHSITNYVTVNAVANTLLACGGSPIMADDVGEVEEITGLCDGLNLNIGTLHQGTVPAMLLAGKKANQLQHPVLLDPVGAGASRMRTETARRLMQEIQFSAIRGNISEIMTLMRRRGSTKGVDADGADAVTWDNVDVMAAAFRKFSEETGCILAVTGAIDLVCDREHCYVIQNGRPEMGLVTGTGCQLSGMMTAFLAANPENLLEAAASAVCAMGLAGEIAWNHMLPQDGNVTYGNRIIDAVSCMTGEILQEGALYEIL